MFKKRFIIACMHILPFGTLMAQVFNNGQIISISTNGLLFIDDNYTHVNGFILNNGDLKLNGNWTNNSATLVFDNQSTGFMHFTGGQQQIGGTSKTGFPSVALSGTGHKILYIDANIAGSLLLNNIEFRLDKFALNINNTNTNAISRTNGFISTDNKGKLYRSTSSAGSYLFPFGSTASNPTIYRPVSIEPQAAGANVYSGTFYYKDPSLEGYDHNSKRQDIENVLEKYFYVLSYDSGVGSTSVKFFQNTTIDADYKQIVKWASPMIWEKAAPSTGTDGTFGDGLNRHLLFSSLDNFRNQPFTFASAANVDDPLTLFNAFSPDGDGKNDTWVIKNLDLYPNNELLIFNRWGDEVYKAKSYNSSNAWDGANLQSGTYFYVLVVDINGQKKQYKGFISMAKN